MSHHDHDLAFLTASEVALNLDMRRLFSALYPLMSEVLIIYLRSIRIYLANMEDNANSKACLLSLPFNEALKSCNLHHKK